MADTKITDLSALTALASGDYVPVVDVSDTSMAASGTTKKITAANLAGGTFGARVYKAAAQTISNDSDTNLTFDTERYDTSAFHDTVTNNNRMTIPSGLDGLYLLTAHVQWAAATGGTYRRIAILHSADGDVARQANAPLGASTPVAQTVTAIWPADAAEFFYVQVRQDSGGNLDTGATAVNRGHEFSIVRLGPLP